MVWSHVGRARRALNRVRASSVPVLTRIQPQFGKYRSIVSRHALTGRAKVMSLSHEIGVAAKELRGGLRNRGHA